MPLTSIQLATISPSNRAEGRFTVTAHSDDGHKFADFMTSSEHSAVKLRDAIREHADHLAHVFDNTREARAKAVPAPSLMRHLAKLDLIGFGSMKRGDDETDGMAAIDELVSQRAQAHTYLASLGYTTTYGEHAPLTSPRFQKWWFELRHANGDVETGEPQQTETEAYHDALMHALARLPAAEQAAALVPGIHERPAWRDEWNSAAELEGWAIFNENEIQADSDSELFQFDEDAVAHVKRLAEAGSAMHLAAYLLHLEHAS